MGALSRSAAGASFHQASGTLIVSKGQPKETLSSTRKQVPRWTMDPAKQQSFSLVFSSIWS